ncbi:MAG: RHS repeat protein, partial [Crocinitomicaceae bacterium]|nr:RHS repeat protein [Crocinitomicaceae bacterium]
LQTQICPPILSTPIPSITLEEFPCEQLTANADTVNANNQYEIYIENTRAHFQQRYIEEAMSSLIENFDMEYPDKEYHYTLYYYDQAGNLVQTVPPKGVDRAEASLNTGDINTARAANTTPTGTNVLPTHTYETIYEYNSLNQLVRQVTPDGGESHFAYDELGRLVISQNAKQETNDKYSYTRYDEIGRIIEVGEMTIASSSYEFNDGKFEAAGGAWVNVSADNFPENLTGIAREEVTVTIYDELESGTFTSILSEFADYSDGNTRNRITGVLYFENYLLADALTSYENATFYDYDVHGNVKELIQDINDSDLELITSSDQTRKSVNYEYDLVSGNVNQVTYQDGETDEFSHKYCYDADNRITKVYTSNNGRIWEQDAKYFYYDHGPLARVEIGDKKVQANDFAYTIQGWLKGVNSEDLDRDNDQGKDGKVDGLNHMNAEDAFGYSLHYFEGDYQARQSNDFLAISETSTPTAHDYDLYNGNIKEMYTAGMKADGSLDLLPTSHTWYRYDQLNRIKTMDQENINVSGSSPTLGGSKYAATYSYDENGNLTYLQRWADVADVKTLIDDFNYNYIAGTNQLKMVNDAVAGAPSGDDLETQSLAPGGVNYTYNEIGELESDWQEEIDQIDWMVTGKVKSITRTGISTKDNLEFTYDAMGNRIVKAVFDNSTDDLISKTFYIRDAQGNVMAIYEYKVEDDGNGPDKNLYIRERNIYGSSRVGIENVNEIIASSDATNVNIDTDVERKVGDKQFELSNHLGNVL